MDVVAQSADRVRVEVGLTRLEFCAALASGGQLVDRLSEMIAGSPFEALTWENPFLDRATAGLPSEFVLVHAPDLAARRPDLEPFADLLSAEAVRGDSGRTDEASSGGVGGNHVRGGQVSGGEAGGGKVVVADNLGGDARLVIPRPLGPHHWYPDLAAFVRQAPRSQVRGVWSAAGRLALAELECGPRWLSTAGGGVAWLHVRLDEQPKYVRHAPYRTPSG